MKLGLSSSRCESGLAKGEPARGASLAPPALRRMPSPWQAPRARVSSARSGGLTRPLGLFQIYQSLKARLKARPLADIASRPPVNELDLAYSTIPEAERDTWYERVDRALAAASG